MKIYDGHNHVLRATEDGLWIGPSFDYFPPMARVLGLPRVELVEPLRVVLAVGETPEDGERELARMRWRFAGSPVAAESVHE